MQTTDVDEKWLYVGDFLKVVVKMSVMEIIWLMYLRTD